VGVRCAWAGGGAAAGASADGAGRRARGPPFQALEPRVEIEVEIALALLDLLVLVGEHLELTAQPRDLGVDLLELADQLHHADVADQLLEALDAHLVVLALLRELGAQGVDAAAGLVVVEEARARGPGRGQREERAGRGKCLTHRRT
jgi:hypothetical protein